MHISPALSGHQRWVVRRRLPWLLLAAIAAVTLAAPAAAQGPADDAVGSARELVDRAQVLPGGARAAQAPVAQSLVGTFLLDPGACDGPSGTYFQMVQPGGSPDEGPYVDNNDSTCDDSSVTPLRPGTDGGLITGSYQPHPDQAFEGNAGRADRITQPQPFFGTAFAVATNPTDPQTGVDVPAPEITVDDTGALSGDVRSFGAAWQAQHFNQGSPKPDGSTDGGTTPVTGTYDRATGHFVLEWSSEIQGGPFNNFTGVWHLEGTFQPEEPETTTSTPDTDAPATSTPAPEAAVASTSGPATGDAQQATATPTGSLASTGGGGLSMLAVVLIGLGVVAFGLLRRISR